MTTKSQQFGRIAESLARRHLKKSGYQILAQNYRNRYGEIDIVAQYGDIFIFVEVKARSSASFGSPAAAVTRDKQKKISMAALGYLKQIRRPDARARFDVVCIEGTGSRTRVDIIADAFPLAYG